MELMGKGALQSSLSTLHVPVVSDVSLVFGTVDYPFDSLLEAGVR